MNDRDPDLRALRSEVPLQDADYAAIRARVRAEIARREERRSWLSRLVFFPRYAAVAVAVVALIAAFVVLREHEPRTVVVTKNAPGPQHTPLLLARSGASAPPLVAFAPAPLPPAPAETSLAPAVSQRASTNAIAQHARTPRRARKPKPAPIQIATIAEPMRIELQTADPDVRIIWIFPSEPPKEKS